MGEMKEEDYIAREKELLERLTEIQKRDEGK
jgi:hypothetical protein